MGNNIGGRRKRAKIMKIDGEIFKLKIPAIAMDVLKDYPGYVLLEYEAVKRFGIRAQPLQPEENMKPNKIYFLVDLPKFPVEKFPTRTRSAVAMSAKDRLECLMLNQRSASDLSVTTSSSTGPVRVKMRLPRARIEKIMEESRDEVEMAEKILHLCHQNSGKDKAQLRSGIRVIN
ncbi:plastid movement impaired 2 [Abeliophyllum distichum]|uniref:Plastid movement impaired 2 n=1 Tax=Abeliophyllum distichum TaxID=126358 RepID=A0ABD1SII1_9LAMI